jgi:hypothetical protein
VPRAESRAEEEAIARSGLRLFNEAKSSAVLTARVGVLRSSDPYSLDPLRLRIPTDGEATFSAKCSLPTRKRLRAIITVSRN